MQKSGPRADYPGLAGHRSVRYKLLALLSELGCLPRSSLLAASTNRRVSGHLSSSCYSMSAATAGRRTSRGCEAQGRRAYASASQAVDQSFAGPSPSATELAQASGREQGLA